MGHIEPFQFLLILDICRGFLLSVLSVQHPPAHCIAISKAILTTFHRQPQWSQEPMGHGLQLDGSTPRQPLMNMGAVRTSDLATLLPIVNRSSRVLACIASNEPSVQTPCRKSESTWSAI